MIHLALWLISTIFVVGVAALGIYLVFCFVVWVLGGIVNALDRVRLDDDGNKKRRPKAP